MRPGRQGPTPSVRALSTSPRFVTAGRAAKLPSVAAVRNDGGVVEPRVPPLLPSVQAVPADRLQFHATRSPSSAQAAAGARMRAARPARGSDCVRLGRICHPHEHARAILVDAHVDGYGGGGKAFDWSRLPPSVNAHLVLSGGLTPANVTDGIAQVRPRCRSLSVDVSSGVEVSKGIKDPEKIHQFVAAVRAADRLLA